MFDPIRHSKSWVALGVLGIVLVVGSLSFTSARADDDLGFEDDEEIPTETTEQSVSTADTPSDTIPTDSEVSATNTTQVERRNLRVPLFHYSKPQWAVEIEGSLKAFGGKQLVAVQGNNLIRAFTLRGEFQPAGLQDIGVVSIGPSVSLYPVLGSDSPVTPSKLSIWSAGGQVMYQARYFREQPVVPILGYSMEYLRYEFNQTGAKGSFMAQGPFLGGMLLLNVLEPTAAAEFYVQNGVARSYLVAEMRFLSGSDANIRLDGSSFFFGLRFEF